MSFKSFSDSGNHELYITLLLIIFNTCSMSHLFFEYIHRKYALFFCMCLSIFGSEKPKLNFYFMLQLISCYCVVVSKFSVAVNPCHTYSWSVGIACGIQFRVFVTFWCLSPVHSIALFLQGNLILFSIHFFQWGGFK